MFCTVLGFFFFFLSFFLIFIYSLSVLGLNWGMQDPSLQHVGSRAHGLCGM